jgi:S1-C subfamily serine protease
VSSLREFSKELGRVVAQALPSIVTIQSGRCASASGLVWSGDRVVAAASRLRREDGLEALVGGERRPAHVLGFDAASDLAVLRVDGELPAAPRRASEAPSIGELVLALGRDPVPVARLGVAARTGGEWRLPGGGRFERYLESDIAPSGALAGSALLDASGELVGVNSVAIARGRLVALPVESVDRIVEAIAAHGRLRRARLGVSVQRVELPAGLANEVGRKHGLIVLSVQQNSPGEAAGIVLGDVLLRLGEAPLERTEELQGALEADMIDQTVELEFWRAGKLARVRIVPKANG